MEATQLRPTRYYQGRLWKVSWTVSKVGRQLWRIVKFYERREAVGAPWRIVSFAVCETRTAP